MQPAVYLGELLLQHPSFTVWVLILLLLFHKLHSDGIGFGLPPGAGSPEQENILQGVNMTKRVLTLAQGFIIMGRTSKILIEFKQSQCAPNCMI
jgi:hypothetical protein